MVETTIKKLNLLLIAILLVASLAVFIPNASATVTWTYNAGTNIATASGSGSTNFAALVAADTAGGWGKFTADATGTQILCKARIVIGDGTNTITFSDTDKQVFFISGLVGGSFYNLIRLTKYATMTLGLVSDVGAKIVSNGVSITSFESVYDDTAIIGSSSSSNDATTVLNLYGVSFNSPNKRGYIIMLAGTVTAWHVIGSNVGFQQNTNVNNDFYDMYISKLNSHGFYMMQGTMSKITVVNSTYGISAYHEFGFNVSNVNSMNNSYNIYFVAVTSDSYLINPDISVWSLYFTGTTSNKLYRQYEFDLTVLNGDVSDFVEDANVTLSRSGSTLGSWLTNSSGGIPQQIETYGYYDQAHGDTIQGASDPFILTITHDDWATYTSRFYITDKMSLVVSMQENVDVTPDPSVYQTIDTGNNMAIIAGMFVAIIVFVVTIIIAKGRS